MVFFDLVFDLAHPPEVLVPVDERLYHSNSCLRLAQCLLLLGLQRLIVAQFVAETLDDSVDKWPRDVEHSGYFSGCHLVHAKGLIDL